MFSVWACKSNWISFGWAKKQTGIEYFDKSNEKSKNCTFGWSELSLVYIICIYMIVLIQGIDIKSWWDGIWGIQKKCNRSVLFIRCKLISFLWEVQISFLQVNAVQIWISTLVFASGLTFVSLNDYFSDAVIWSVLIKLLLEGEGWIKPNHFCCIISCQMA